MRPVDIDRFRFDFDLTLAVLLAHPDGTVYHRFGGRDESDPLVWSSMTALLEVMRSALEEHAAYVRAPAPPEGLERRPLDLPILAEKLADKPQECVHCHSVHDAERDLALREGRLGPDDIWIYPPPARVGLELDPIHQNRVRAVHADSPAARAGLRAGDVLVRVGAQRIASVHDLTWVLHRAAPGETSVAMQLERDGEPLAATLELGAGWKRGDALSFSWRPYKWGLRPGPGFGGRALDAAEKRALGLEPEAFALRVTYLIEQGPDAELGRRARAAGLLPGDLLLGVDGRADFRSHDHFQAWVRLERRPGDVLRLRTLRAGTERLLELELLP